MKVLYSVCLPVITYQQLYNIQSDLTESTKINHFIHSKYKTGAENLQQTRTNTKNPIDNIGVMLNFVKISKKGTAILYPSSFST